MTRFKECAEDEADKGGHAREKLPRFTMAFQPIVHETGVYAHEALVRGPQGESAKSLFSQIDASNLYTFDQACRICAIEMAAGLRAQPPCISINFVPGAIYQPETCIQKTIETAERVGMPLSNIIFEVSETEKVTDTQMLVSIFREYRSHGLRTAIDDFGAGYSGLDLLSEFQPELVKLDIALIRNIHLRPASRAIVRAIASLCRELDILTIAEGVETEEELTVLRDIGLELFQGYLFARPALAAFVEPVFPRAAAEHPGMLHMPRSSAKTHRPPRPRAQVALPF